MDPSKIRSHLLRHPRPPHQFHLDNLTLPAVREKSTPSHITSPVEQHTQDVIHRWISKPLYGKPLRQVAYINGILRLWSTWGLFDNGEVEYIHLCTEWTNRTPWNHFQFRWRCGCRPWRIQWSETVMESTRVTIISMWMSSSTFSTTTASRDTTAILSRIRQIPTDN